MSSSDAVQRNIEKTTTIFGISHVTIRRRIFYGIPFIKVEKRVRGVKVAVTKIIQHCAHPMN